MYGPSERAAAKAHVPLELYQVERVAPTQLDLVPTGRGWHVAQPRRQLCLQLESAAAAERWLELLARRTWHGCRVRQFGVPLWYFEARGDALPLVFMDCVRALYNHALSTPELFRQGGDADDVK